MLSRFQGWAARIGPLLIVSALAGCRGSGGTRSADNSPIRSYATIGDHPVRSAPETRTARKPGRISSRVGGRGAGGQAALTGRVVDSEGTPVANASVRIAYDGATGSRDIVGTTDRTGSFRLAGLRPDRSYTLIAEWQGEDEQLVGRTTIRGEDRTAEIEVADPGAARSRPVGRRGDELSSAGFGAEPLLLGAARPARHGDPAAIRAQSPDDRVDDAPHRTAWEPTAADELMGREAGTSETEPGFALAEGRGIEAAERNPLPPALDRIDRDALPPAEPIVLDPSEPADATLPQPDSSGLDPSGRLRAMPETLPLDRGPPPRLIPPTATAPDPTAPPVDAVHADVAADAPTDADPLELPGRAAQGATPPEDPAGPAAEVVPSETHAEPSSEASHPTEPSPLALEAPDEAPVPRVEDAMPEPFAEVVLPDDPSGVPLDGDPFQEPAAPIVEPEPDAEPTPAAEEAIPPLTWNDLPPPGVSLARAEEPGDADVAAPAADERRPWTGLRQRILGRRDETVAASCRFDPRYQRLADFTMPDLRGRAFRRTDVDSDLLLIAFWGSWSDSCLEAVGHLDDLQQHFDPGQLQVVGIAYEQSDPATRGVELEAVARRLGLHFPILVGPTDGTCPLQNALNIQYYPTYVLIDRYGRIQWRGTGGTRETLLRLDRAVNASIQNVAELRTAGRAAMEATTAR